MEVKKPRVWNKRDPNCPKDAVYVGRPSKWGNPFSHIPGKAILCQTKTREESIQLYSKWIRTIGPFIQDLRAYDQFEELRGKDLACWCAPAACHADILLELCNRPK